VRGLDLVLSSKKDKDVALGLGGVDLEDGGDGGVEVICFGLRRVVDVDGVPTAWDCRLAIRRRRCR
jgi:hypothetical protein